MRFDVIVVGASVGGVQAARKAAEAGKRVYLCEATDWIGGQLTAQAVPPDEHPWIEEQGATASYRQFREDVRAHYRNLPNASEEMKQEKNFSPGKAWVSKVAHEPKVGLHLLEQSLAPYIENKLLTLDLFTVIDSAKVEKNTIVSVTVKNIKTGEIKVLEGDYFLDGTDCGDLLPLVGAEYRSGRESIAMTGEPHATETADAEDVQPFTWVAAVELSTEESYIPLEQPPFYQLFSNIKMPYDDNMLYSWFGPNAQTGKKHEFSMFPNEKEKAFSLWDYRRIIYPPYYTDEQNEVMLLNWPENDYSFGSLFDDANAELHAELSKYLTLGLIYWLQNEAPRLDGGKGYRITLRPDITGTEDGLAKAAYMRESRRILAKRTVAEQDISKDTQDEIPIFEDSVGVGYYGIDLHPTIKTFSHCFASVWPFEIPLSAMVPVRITNLIPACKNIGSTHLTNGCFRLHPVEWNVGEVAGILASFCLENRITPAEVLESKLEDFQAHLVREGVQLHWDQEQLNNSSH